MSVWAIVPVKPLCRAKSRLADELSPEQREQLAVALLEQTVRLLTPLPQIQGVLVISRDTRALALVRDLGAQTVQESGAPELNKALLRATQVIKAWGTSAALVVPADLPLLAAGDVVTVIELGHHLNSVVIAPDRHEQGTNLLFIRPPGLIPYWFGENSFAEHQRLAHEAHAALHVYRSERLALDLDTPDDLRHYVALARTLGEPVLPVISPDAWLVTDQSI